jgi:hypothetical protein
VQLDENLTVESVVAMRLPVSFTVEKATAVLPVLREGQIS